MKKMNMAAVATFGLAFLLAGCGENATGDGDDLLSSSSLQRSSSSSVAESSSGSLQAQNPFCVIGEQCLSGIAQDKCSAAGGIAADTCPAPSPSSSSQSGGISSSAVAVSSSSSSSLAPSSSSSFPASGNFTDERDGQEYSYVTIGNQVWMAKNLNYNASGSRCKGYDCATYGRLYDWATAMAISIFYNALGYRGSDVNHRGVCPSGWHLPSDDEWTTLANGDYGRSFVGNDSYWWGATESNTSAAYGSHFDYNNADLYTGRFDKLNGLSVRCLRY